MVQKRNAKALQELGQSPPGIKITETSFSAADGTRVRAKLYQPTTPPAGGSSLIVLFHGGGFCVGTPENEELTARNLVYAFGSVVFNASYRQAPEFKFPCAVDDSWEAVKYAAVSAQTWGADPSVGFIIGGTSAGGNLSAVLSHYSRDEGLSPPITGHYLATPTVLSSDKVPEKYRPYYLSYKQNKNAPLLSHEAIAMFHRGYQPDFDDAVKYNVFNHPKGHKDLTPAFFQINGLDPLRDEALIYERVLAENGVKTRLEVYPGVPHGRWGFFPFLKTSGKFRKDQLAGFGWLLNKEPKIDEYVVFEAPSAGV